jgi:glutamate-1-semialdehyde 2,1-aminomutase
VIPDITTLGKIIGGGMPVGAYGGRRDLMEQMSPAGPVYQAGTLSGNPLAVAAGLATLELLDAAGYERLEMLGQRLESGMRAAIESKGWPLRFQRVGSMFCLYFRRDAVRNYEDARACDLDAFTKYFHGMLERGVYLAPSQFEAGFLSLAHDEADVDRTLEAGAEVLGTLY